jgi:hypothetical protein
MCQGVPVHAEPLQGWNSRNHSVGDAGAAVVQGIGDIEDLRLEDGSIAQCLTCPWHDFKMSIVNGHKYMQRCRSGSGHLHDRQEWHR